MLRWISKVLSVTLIFVLFMSSHHGFARQADGGAAEGPSVAMKEALEKLSKEMIEQVEKLRGWKFKRPVDVGFFSAEEIRAFLSSDETEGEDRPGKEGEDRLDEKAAQRALELVGVMAEGSDPDAEFEAAMMVSVPNGIYDHKEKELRLLYDEGVDLDSLSARMTLAHELGHALDDQCFDLSALEKKGGATSDMQQVWGAIIEGSGVTLQERYKIEAETTGRFDVQKYDESVKKEIAQMKALFEAPPFVASFMARFPCGVRFLQRGDLGKTMALLMGTQDPGGVGDTLRLVIDAYPRSFEQVLHPEKYFDAAQKDEPVVIDDDVVRKTLSRIGLHVIHTDTLGELYCAMVCDPPNRVVNPMFMAAPGYWTNQGGIGWGGRPSLSAGIRGPGRKRLGAAGWLVRLVDPCLGQPVRLQRVRIALPGTQGVAGSQGDDAGGCGGRVPLQFSRRPASKDRKPVERIIHSMHPRRQTLVVDPPYIRLARAGRSFDC